MTGDKIIDTAKRYLGDGGAKFWADYGLPKGDYWCCAFVWDIFRIAGASELFYGGQKTAYVPTATVWLQYNCRHVTMAEAQPGDIVVFTWTGKGYNKERGSRDHIGFIRKVGNQNTCYTIEGNTGADKPINTKVMERTRASKYIYGIYRPNYSDVYTIAFKPRGGEGTMEILKVSEGETVKLPANKFKREGFKFAGWSKGKSNVITMKHFQIGKVKYKNKEKVKDLAKAGKVVKLYACWRGNGPAAAARWARLIAADNSFAYGTGKRAHHCGCYYCGTNITGPKHATKGSAWDKTYCCNPFVWAAYVHGANYFSKCKNSGLNEKWWLSQEHNGKKMFKRLGVNVKYSDLKPGDVLLKENHHVKMYVGKVKGFMRVSQAKREGWDKGSITTNKVIGRIGKDYVALRAIS